MKIFKFISIIVVVIGSLVLIHSCNPDNLELVNPNELSPETYFRTEAQVQSAVNACYGNLQTRGLYNRHIWFGYENCGHENSGNPQLEADKRQYLDFTFDASHGPIGAFWESCYRGINKANFVINNAEVIAEIPDAQLSAARKAKFDGEVKFMRALYYFMLVTRFGDVPLVLEVPEDGEGLARTSAAQIWAQIESDLTDATTQCLSKDVEDAGRATSEAAWALLGKVHLYQQEWQDAIDAFDNIMNGEYALEDVYFNNFMEETEHGVESIFEVEFNIGAGNANRWDSDRTDQGLNESCFRGQEYGWNDWFNVYPSTDLLNEFETGDPRYAQCFYSVDDLFNNGNDTVHSIQYDRTAAWRKYQNYYKQPNENQESGINMKIIRYADVILMRAEAENELTHTAEAIGYLNQIRNRADVMMPNYPTAEYPCGSQAEIKEAIIHERKVELCGEQIRYPDLVRWGLLDDFIQSAELFATLPAEEQAALVFDPDIHTLWPIPQGELDNNANINQENQNPGY